MHLLNSSYAGTLVSVEIYEGSDGALDTMYDSDSRRDSVVDTGEVKHRGYKVRQIISKTKYSYAVRQYFSSKSKIYILTTATRADVSDSMKRFLDSVVFVPNSKGQNIADGISVSTLKKTEVVVEMKLEDHKQQPKSSSSASKVMPGDVKSLSIVSKPYASYTGSARSKRVSGTIRLRITFAEDGSMPNIAVVETLPEGLLRQAIFAALRIKFLPKEINGKPIRTIATFDYGFSTY